nr:hypothetical protein [Tanacetum cinerariifolium]
MSNTNNNLQTQTSNALHNAIMEAGGKGHPPMLALSYYVQWKSRIKIYIDTKPNNELIRYCLQNPTYKFNWTEKTDPVAEGSSETTTEGYMETYKNVSQDIRDQLNAEAEAEKEINKLMALISISFKKIYKPTNNNLRTSSNTSRANRDNTPRINRGTGYDNQRVVYVARARDNIDATDNSKPIFDAEPLQHVQNNDDNYNLFAIECEHPKQPETINDTYLEEQGDTNITIESLDMCNNEETVNQYDDDNIVKERDLLASAIQADCDVKATNIILQGHPPEERECKLYDEFDKFAYKKGETLREFYLTFSLLLNDMNIYDMKLEQFQVNTKFLNTLPPEWSKFVTDVKVVRDLHTTNVSQLHAYLGQHEFHANEKGNNPIDAGNHMMSFLTAVVTSR